MVAGRLLAFAVLCVASVSCIEKALIDKFAQVAANDINKDVVNGDKLYKVQKTSNVFTNQDRILFKLYLIETICTQAENAKNDTSKCQAEKDAPVVEHKVTVQQHKGGVYSVSSQPISPQATKPPVTKPPPAKVTTVRLTIFSSSEKK